MLAERNMDVQAEVNNGGVTFEPSKLVVDAEGKYLPITNKTYAAMESSTPLNRSNLTDVKGNRDPCSLIQIDELVVQRTDSSSSTGILHKAHDFGVHGAALIDGVANGGSVTINNTTTTHITKIFIFVDKEPRKFKKRRTRRVDASKCQRNTQQTSPRNPTTSSVDDPNQ
ncbi:hypothetical protein BDQ17DRAFT_1454826 [Cyathus striatus]|nr:hypothetical protein BDQ17DRAFT_1454826 [Cyathus striatus]